MTLVELSHVIEDGMTTYPGLPAPEIGSHLSFEESAGVYASGTEFAIGRIAMVANTGTYLDTPAHRFRDGHDLAGLALERCADLAGTAVLIRTGWDRHWRTERYGHPTHPFLTADGARHLVAAGVALVGIDSVNIDDTSPAAAGQRPTHTTLLAAGVPVVEHLTGLDELPTTGARFFAAPPRVAGMATFPVRAFVIVR